MSMLIPKQWEHKMAFQIEALKALAATDSVLERLDLAPRRRDPLDCRGVFQIMVKLCQEGSIDGSGIEDMGVMVSTFDKSVRLRRALSDDEFQKASASTRRYMAWLNHVFRR